MSQRRVTLEELANRTAQIIYATPNLTMDQRISIASRVVDDSPAVGAVMAPDGTVRADEALALRTGELQRAVTAALRDADPENRFIHPGEASPTDAVADDVISGYQLADLAGVGIDTVRSWSIVYNGIRPIRIGHHMLFPRSEVLNWLSVRGHLMSVAAVPVAVSE